MYSRFITKIFPFYVFVFSFFIISQFGKHFFFSFSYLSGIRIDYLAPALYFTDILSFPFIFIFFIHSYKRLNHYKKWVENNIFFVSFFIILLLLNFYFSLSKPLWLYSFARLIQFTFLFLFFRHYGNKKEVYVPLVGGLFLGSCFELVLSLLQLSMRHSIQGWWYYLGERSFSIFTPGIAKAYFMGKEFLRPYGTFSHPNSLGGFYLLLYIFILTQKKPTHVLLKGAFLFISSALILISFSRTSIAVYVFINLLYFLRTITACKVCTIAKISIGIVLILFALNISGDSNSFQKRTDFFEKSLAIIAQKPFTGTGIGSYLIAQHQYPQKFSTFFEQPVHNIFLLIIAQIGIPFSVFIFFSMYRYVVNYLKKKYFLLPFICILLTGSIDHYWITLQQNVLALAMIFGILFIYEKKTSRA